MLRSILFATILIVGNISLSSEATEKKAAIQIDPGQLELALSLIKEKYKTTLTEKHLRNLHYSVNDKMTHFYFYLREDPEISSELRFEVVIKDEKVVHHKKEGVD